MFREMTVSGLTIDPFTNSPIMILKDVASDKAVPIWIGLLEATAIASELENIKFSRPMTHDLLKNIMELMETQVTKVEVCDLRDNTYFALIYLSRDGNEITIDARPSDAIAIALRTKAPIFVADVVIQEGPAGGPLGPGGHHHRRRQEMDRDPGGPGPRRFRQIQDVVSGEQ